VFSSTRSSKSTEKDVSAAALTLSLTSTKRVLVAKTSRHPNTAHRHRAANQPQCPSEFLNMDSGKRKQPTPGGSMPESDPKRLKKSDSALDEEARKLSNEHERKLWKRKPLPRPVDASKDTVGACGSRTLRPLPSRSEKKTEPCDSNVGQFSLPTSCRWLNSHF
jgi:hypothetical protein